MLSSVDSFERRERPHAITMCEPQGEDFDLNRAIQPEYSFFVTRKGEVMDPDSTWTMLLEAYRTQDWSPAFDGLVAAQGSLYMVTESGSILCFESR
ncbi:MAG: hypothetical protein HQ582_23010 [Planctomycetes bacterium]|nr:hypothetical protein [Planctomycetota bacterium]